MARIEVSTRVQAPLEETFAVHADLERAPERISAIRSLEILTDGPVGLGTRWRETREMFGKEATEEMEITRFEPPRRYDVEAESHGSRYRSVLTFDPVTPTETRVRMSFEAIPLTWTAKLLSPTWLLFKSSTRKALQADLDELAHWIEARAEAPPATSPASPESAATMPVPPSETSPPPPA